MTQLGPNAIPFEGWEHVDANPFFVANAIDRRRARSVHGRAAQVRRLVRRADRRWSRRGVPVGWGEPVYGKLDADIAHAMMGINAVKGVEIGAGFAARRAARHRAFRRDDAARDFSSNHAGGILGGISTGQDVVVAIAVKPTSSIRLDRHSIDKAGQPVDRQHARPSRSVRRHSRDADRRGDAGAAC